jgi:hypothetical protein
MHGSFIHLMHDPKNAATNYPLKCLTMGDLLDGTLIVDMNVQSSRVNSSSAWAVYTNLSGL